MIIFKKFIFLFVLNIADKYRMHLFYHTENLIFINYLLLFIYQKNIHNNNFIHLSK